MSTTIAVDIGGTFTDCIVVDEQGERTAAKALTTPDHLEQGVLDALDVAARTLGTTRQPLLASAERFVHGTTQATNVMVTRLGARTGLITTKGHEDTLIIGRVYSKMAGLTERELVHASQLRKPDPIIPRALTRGVTERMDREGEAVVDLDEAEAVRAIGELVDAGVESVAVSLLWSFLNPAHERRIAELLAEHAPDVFVSLSCEVAPVLGEYERAATVAVDAYVGPTVAGYLRALESRLQADGLRHPLLVMQASGGLTSVPEAALTPVVTLDSGPAGGVLGCAHLGRLLGEENLICTDVGGTTFDVGVILNGRVPLIEEPVISQYTLKLPKVRVEAIGAGGGSIAWLDEGQLLRVGPHSAGSRPGPACYGLGGAQPTVTDADLLLGYLDPDAFLGGEMALDVGLARAALGRLGRQMGLEPEQVAAGVFRIVNAQMADLISKATISQGHDPRECVLVAYGGAGPTHAAFYGEDLDVKEILIPAESTVFSAEGMLTCDVVHSLSRSRTLRPPLGEADLAQLNADLGDLERRVLGQFEREGTSAAEVSVQRSLGMRYRNQVLSLEVPIGAGDLDDAGTERLGGDFATRYAEVYGAESMLRNAPLEIDQHKVQGTLPVTLITFPEMPESAEGEPEPAATRSAYFDGGFVSTPVFRGESLAPGHELTGPAIVQRMGDSIVVPPGCVARIDGRMSLHLRRAGAGAPSSPLTTVAGA